MNIQARLFGYSIIALSLVSCATGYKVPDLEYPIELIHDIVKSNLPAPLVSRSINGREYATGPYRVPLEYRHTITKNPKGPPSERAYATLSILGETRPYTVNVKIEIEDLVSGGNEKPRYVICCRNPGMEKDLGEKIKKDLVKRNAKSNKFDDYTPF